MRYFALLDGDSDGGLQTGAVRTKSEGPRQLEGCRERFELRGKRCETDLCALDSESRKIAQPSIAVRAKQKPRGVSEFSTGLGLR